MTTITARASSYHLTGGAGDVRHPVLRPSALRQGVSVLELEAFISRASVAPDATTNFDAGCLQPMTWQGETCASAEGVTSVRSRSTSYSPPAGKRQLARELF